MRLRFGALSAEESAARARLVRRGREAWLALAGGDVEAARRAMQAIDDRLGLVVDASDASRPPSVELTALETSVWGLAELLLSEAPTELTLLRSLGRVARPLDVVLSSLRSEHGVDLSRARFRAGFTRGHLLELTLSLPGGSGAEIEQICGEKLVRGVLGDRLFETWVGAVQVTPAPRGGPLRVLDGARASPELTLEQLFDTVAAAVLGALRGLPRASFSGEAGADEPGRRVRDDWVLLEMEPLDGARLHTMEDLMLASTCAPELLRCYLDGAPCSSRRFSRSGERFVYLSYLDGEQAPEARVARRDQLETRLGETLRGVVSVVAAGLGLHCSYLGLALCNLETGLARLVSEMRGQRVPPASFIRFFDSELSEEWLSIWPDSRP